MSYKPDSKILIVTICSLNKKAGGIPEYNEKNSIKFKLGGWLIRYLHSTREKIRNMIEQDMITWQKVPASKLPFNKNLVRGKDFGGNKHANYLLAIERYNGRLYRALEKEGKEKLLRSRHHVLILSGLYGLVTPTEPIQLYSCPLDGDSEVQKIWKKDNGLTNVLVDYIVKECITRIFDLTALKDYRNLIDWPTIRNKTKAEVLHCFAVMAAGDYALIEFGDFLKEFMLKASEEDLLAITPDTEINDLLVSSIPKPGKGLPTEEELKKSPSYYLKDIHKALEIDLPSDIREVQEPSLRDWKVYFRPGFEKKIDRCKDKNLRARILKAIMEICKAPTTPYLLISNRL